MNCDSAGRYSVPLPPGAHAVSDWTFDPDRCALPPAVTPAPVSVPGPAIRPTSRQPAASCSERGLGAGEVVPPAGIEPAPSAPEADTLSAELRGRTGGSWYRVARLTARTMG